MYAALRPPATALQTPSGHLIVYRNNTGHSLIELLIALSILAMVAATVSLILTGTLRSQRASAQHDELVQTARLAMERMVVHIRRANRTLLPLANNPTRSVLALGGFVDNDGDGRYDEDPPDDRTADGAAGIVSLDDDGDSSTDEGLADDDDEDGAVNEDAIDGIDNDSDGAIDEDPPAHGNEDNHGGTNEDPIEPVVYYLDTTTRTLRERFPINSTTSVTTDLAAQVEVFQVQRLVGANGVTLINILLRLKDTSGNVVELQTQAAPRNVGS
jgi:prepilin-type N-terminal cleavage/methylation domain-containing protein